jgi:hypothetical protein
LKREREELRRGLRSFIQDAGTELAEFTRATSAPPAASDEPAPPRPAPPRPAPQRPPQPATLDAAIRPILKLVRDIPQPEAPAQPSFEEFTMYISKKGVCAAYFTNKRCWELPDAYCNQALHVCRLRECPVYDLHREDMEKRFASKFKHLW